MLVEKNRGFSRSTKYRNEVKAWIKNPNSSPTFNFPEDYIGTEVIGRGITKQEYLDAVQKGLTPVCKDLKGARVVLKKTTDGQGYFILTSFPK